MNLKTIFRSFYDYVRNYNLFMSETNADHDEDDELEPPAIVLNRQRYTTWLYIFLLIVSLYVVFYIALMKSQSQTITVSNITLTSFKQLYLEHAKTLSCPCSTIHVPYKAFVSNTIKFHPVCSSFFVTEQWIEALYRSDASIFDALDFRKTAHSQFKLLASLCSLSKETVFQNKFNLDNHEFVTLYLLAEKEVQSEVIATAERFKDSAIIRIISFINYLRIVTQANYFVSALNTNLVIFISNNFGQYSVVGGWMQFSKDDNSARPAEMICGNANPIHPTGFYHAVNNWYAGFNSVLMPLKCYGMVPGFFAGCTPFEALLPSTLDCLYNVTCLEMLLDYFPILNQTQLNWNKYVLSTQKQNISVHVHLLNLFMEEWSTNINYSMYFDECSVSNCTYTTTEQTNFSYALALLISLYGGFVFILRLIAPFLVHMVLNIKHRSRNIRINSEYVRTRLRKFTTSVKQLNLFKEDDRTESSIRQQKIITRVYLILLIGTFLIFSLFTSLTTRTATIPVSNPSLDTYKSLRILHPNTLKCPCSTMIIPYHKFIVLSPVLHQVCSSDFVSKSWISILMIITNQLIPIDWRNQAGPQFQLLSDLCQLANKTIEDAIRRFIIQSFISSNLLPESDFYTQLNATVDQFFHSTVIYFDQFVDTVHLHMQVDQPFIHLGRVDDARTANIIAHTETDETTGQPSVQFDISLIGTQDTNSTSINCICATNPHCQSSVAIYDVDGTEYNYINPRIAYTIPGLTAGCYVINSLMLSTLQCFYSDSDCLPTINTYIREMYYQYIDFPQWIEVRPLVYDPMLSRFPPNISISEIVKEMMIEKLNPSVSYERYYELCAPSYCTYSDRIRAKTGIGIIVALASTIGGLASSLISITPYLVKCFYYLLETMCKRQQQQQQEQQVRPKWFIRLKTAMQKLIAFLYTKLIEYDIFSIRDFGSHIDRITVKRLGLWATRLYLVLLIIGLAIFALYVAIQPETLTKNFDKPSLHEYNHLKQIHGDKLECSCSVIASKYDHFVNIEPVFHQICSSPFVSDELQMSLAIGLASNLSDYDIKDYRRFFLAHLQYLTGLCQISIQAVNTTINQFLSSLFVTTKLLTDTVFFARLNTQINQSQSNAPIIFNQLLFLIRNINDGNSLISTYGSNFQYTIPWNEIDNGYTHTQALIYDNNCSCGLYHNCTSQANFIKTNSSRTISIKGLKMGCIPSESFRASTLECFYNSSCIDLLQQYTNYVNSTYILSPLSSVRMNRFLINSTIDELVNNLFIESWKTTTNYSLYFKQCSPSLCSYTYIHQFNSFYTITLLLGLEGGLTIVLEWICPKIILIIFKLYQGRKRRTNAIQPVNTDVPSLTINLESLSTAVTTSQPNVSYRKIIISCILLLFILTIGVIFSIYFAREEKNQVTSTNFSTVTTSNANVYMTNSTTASTSTIPTSICQLKFQPITIFDDVVFAPFSPVVGDFNNDDQLDLAGLFLKASALNGDRDLIGYVFINVFLGNGNGTFQSPISLPQVTYYSWLAVDDFNNDKQLDLAFCATRTNLVGVWLGHGNGSFKGPILFPTKRTNPIKIIVAKFNNDNYQDIAVIYSMPKMIGIFLGRGNGSFTEQTTLSPETTSNPTTLFAGDFNNDDYQDIVIADNLRKNIIVFLGYGNGTFIAQKKTFTGHHLLQNSIGVGDFDGDNRLDIILSYREENYVAVMFGYGNGTLSQRKMYIIKTNTSLGSPLVVNDFNHDNHLDVVIWGIDPYSVNVLRNYGNGMFDPQMIFSTKSMGFDEYYDQLHLAIGDFNNDSHQDIIATNYLGSNMILLMNTCECCTSDTVNISTAIHQ